MARVPVSVTSASYFVTFPVILKPLIARYDQQPKFALQVVCFRRIQPILACHFMVNLRHFHCVPILHSRYQLFDWLAVRHPVGVASRYGLDGSRFDPWWGQDFPHCPDRPRAHPASCRMGTECFPGVKRPGREIDHPLPTSVQLKKEQSYTSTTLLCLHGMLQGFIFFEAGHGIHMK